MWQEIANKYPKELIEFEKLIDKTDYGKHYSFYSWDEMEFKSLWGWLLDFFDSKEIYIMINQEVGFWWWDICDKYDKIIDNGKADTRSEAQQSSTLKAFEILHQKALEEK